MSQFVNYSNRGVELPQGCKDLIDLLRSDPEDLPATVRRTTEGLDQLDNYVSRLLSSPSHYCVLSILGFDLETGVFLERCKGVLTVIVVIKTASGAKEQAVREAFRDAQVSSISAEVAGTGGDARVLKYPLPALGPDVVGLIRKVLLVACDATEHAGLYFDYHGNTTA